MKLIYLVCFTVLFCLTLNAQEFGQGSSKPNKGKKQQEYTLQDFQKLTERWIEAYNGGDTTILKSFYSEDAEYISSHVSGLVASGRSKLIANFYNGIKMGGHIERLTVLSVNSSCELTTLVCKYEANNNGEKAVGRNLLVLKLINGKWLIVTHMTVV